MKLLFLLLFFSAALAQGRVIVKNLSIEGQKFIEASLIKNHLSLKEGKAYSFEKVKKDVKNLYALGFFEDVEVFKEDISKKFVNVLYRVKERPLVGEIKFKGNKDLGEEDLKELLEVKEFEFVSFKALKDTLEKIKEKYKNRGYFLSDVSYTVQPLKKGDGKVRLTVQIKENNKVLIKKINFIGARLFSSKKLKSLMMTREQSFFSFLDSSGVYNPQNLDRDLQMIEYLYRDKGYLNIRLEKPEISLTADKRHIYINLSVSEGYRFFIGQVDFQGDEVVSKEKGMSYITLGKSEFFSLGTLLKDMKFIEDLYKEQGYAFARVSPDVVPDQSEDNKVHVLYRVQKGEVYKVGKVRVFGNYSTRDKVILRQLSLEEGSQYKKSEQDQSEALIKRLGFFDDVNLKLKKQKDKEKTLDIEVHLKEREHTGEAQLAGGYNSFHKIFVRGGAKKSNFLGLGHSISLQGDFSRFQELFSFNYQNPYFLDTDWSLSLDVFNMGQDMLSGYDNYFISDNVQDRIFSYSQMNTGFSISLGRHITDYFSSFLKYRLQYQSLSGQSFLFLRRLPILNKFFGSPKKGTNAVTADGAELVSFDDVYPLEEGKGILSSVSGIVEYDKRNDRYYTTKGYFGRLSLEYAGLGGDFDHTKIQGSINLYNELFWKLVLKNSLNYGMVFSNSKARNVPFTELFLLGGPYSLRGFFPNTVGPRKPSKKAFDYAVRKKFKNPEALAQRPYGGSKMFYYNLELELPLISQAGILGALFFDIGEAGNSLRLDLGEGLRANTGAGIRWRSPFGLIRLDWGIPFFPKEELGEERVQFQFSIGSAF